MEDPKDKQLPAAVAAETTMAATAVGDEADPASLNTNTNNPGGASSGQEDRGGMSTPVPIEVITTPPDEDVIVQDFGDQSQAVPPEGAPRAPDDEDAASNVSSSLVAYQFKRFTKDSYQRLVEREEEMKRKAREKKDRPSEGRLVDGELVYDGENGDEPVLERDPNLIEGNTLPEHLEQEFPKELFNQPIEEIDDLIKDKTFVVITKRFKKTYIHRFSATKGFFLLSPWNPIRRAGIYTATSQVFDYFIITTILVNLVILAFPTDQIPETVENVFLAIYVAEMIVKLLARGFILNAHTYLRDPWNWLDFGVIITAFVTLGLGNVEGEASNIQALRAFRVLRAVKTISVIPGLKTIVGALMNSMKMLFEVIVLTFFCMMVFALFTLQVYIGILRHKCVKDIEPGVVVSDYEYALHLKNQSNWYENEDGYLLCGNNTRAGPCPANHTCLPDIGDNPNFGYTSFDNFGWALLSSFQLITLDFWEDIYNKVIRANGPFNVIFFGVVVFFGSFYLINLMLAVVSLSYEEEALQAGKLEKEKERKREKRERKERKERERKERAALSGSNGGGESVEGEGQGDGQQQQQQSTGEDGQTNNNKTSSDTNHLQLAGGGNVNGSNSASNVSLNGQLILPQHGDNKRRMSNSLKLDPDSGAGRGGKEISDGSKLSPDGKVMSDNDQLMSSTGCKQFGQNSQLEDSRSIMSMDNQGDVPGVIIQDDDDQELIDRNCQCCGRCCHGYPRWLAFQNLLYTIVTDLVFELFISACVLFNVICMAIEHHGMQKSLADALEAANLVFTIIFGVEAVLKLMAMSKDYFKSYWNIFDFLIVIVSVFDHSISAVEGIEDVEGLETIKVLRLVRLLRIFRLAQTWTTMKVLISIMVRTLGALGNLTLILFIAWYIFAVFGMQLLGKSYTADKFAPDPIPRFRFDTFSHAIFIIFRILCGEWIEPLWECMIAAGEFWCSFVFFPTLVMGNFVILNLFLALMLNSFATDNLSKVKEEAKDDKMKQGWAKLKGLFKGKSSSVEPQGGMESKKPSIADIVAELKRQQKAVYGDEDDSMSVRSTGSKLSIVEKDRVRSIELTAMNGDSSYLEDESAENAKNQERNPPNGTIKSNKPNDIAEAFQTDRGKFAEFNTAMTENSKKTAPPEVVEVDPKSSKTAWGLNSKGGKNKDDTDRDLEADEDQEDNTVHDCFPPICCSCTFCGCYQTVSESTCGRGWTRFRRAVHKITEHKAFEYFILLIIIGSSLTLAFEDAYLYRNHQLNEVLTYLNYAFAAIFITEMLLKWIAIGFYKYFTAVWTVLDFCIVIITLLSISSESLGLDQISAFKGLRTLRALRPLRAVSRWQGMRIVVNALFYAVPAIANVLLVSLIFWLIFAIAGYNIFGGRFYKCIDLDSEEDDPRLPVSEVPTKAVCLEKIANGSNYLWDNSNINFDNLFSAYLALLQIATFEGWMELMNDAMDMTGLDKQPFRENNILYLWFFVIFIFVGSFFSLNLLIGVIIENFNNLKKKYEGGYLDIFLTDSQKNYYNTMKKLGNRKPQKTIKRPKNKIQGFFFDVAVSTKFELAIVLLIFLNMIAMAIEHYRQPEAVSDALDIVNIIFTTIFTLEAIVKIIGLRWHYFRRMWNVFDLIIVVLSVVGVILDDLLRNIFITPTLLRVVRVFRLGRVLRLIKAAKGIRKLLFALIISLPALLNIGMLLGIIIFIFAVIGMVTFKDVRYRGALDDMTNFEDMLNSLVLLFRLTTAAGWNDILEPLMEEEDCNRTHRVMPDGDVKQVLNGDCGDATAAALFMSGYVLITYMIIINMYIAVILENFNQAHEQEEVGITEDDFEMFYVVWERYDPHATQFIKVENLSDLVADLDLPLGIPKPNEIALVAFDLPIMEGERLHCLDILTSLVKYVLGGVEDTDEFRNLKTQMEERYREAFPTRVTQIQISSTMKRKKEDVAAKTLQRAWRKHKAQQSIRKITSMAMEAKLNKSFTRTSFSAASGNSPIPERPGSSTSSTRSIVISPASKHGNTLKVPNNEKA